MSGLYHEFHIGSLSVERSWSEGEKAAGDGIKRGGRRDRDTQRWIKAAEMKVAPRRKDVVVGHYVVQGAPKSPRNHE